MRPMPVVIAGMVAAALGALLWGIIGYTLQIEVGWIAIIIGAVVGMVCHAAAKDEAGLESGLIAAGLTVAAILGGKLGMSYAFTHQHSDRDYALSAVADQILYEHAQEGRSYQFPKGVDSGVAIGQAEYPPELWDAALTRWDEMDAATREQILACPELANPEYVVSLFADDVIDEWEAAGRVIQWPGGSEPAVPDREIDYPGEVWAEATATWDRLTSVEQREWLDDFVDVQRSHRDEVKSLVFWYTFKSTFGFLDFVFVGIGVLAAIKLGAGLSSS